MRRITQKTTRSWMSIGWAASLLWLALCCTAPCEDWPQWMGAERDGIWRTSGLIREFPEEGPTVRWRVPVHPGYAGPAVADGRLYVMDRISQLDEDGEPIAREDVGLLGEERILCLDANSGETLWEHRYDCPYRIAYPNGPRVTPLIEGERVYTLGAQGDFLCLDTASGDVRWHADLMDRYADEPPFWGFAAHPLMRGDTLITLAGGEGSAVVALDKNTGEEVWKSLTAQEVGYAPPVILQAGGTEQLVVWLDTTVNGLDPDTGEPLWEFPFPRSEVQRPVVPIITPPVVQDRVLVSNFYDGALLLEVEGNPPAARRVWETGVDGIIKRDSLDALMTTPCVRDGYLYGVSGDGEVRCIEFETGQLVWRDMTATLAGAPTDSQDADGEPGESAADGAQGESEDQTGDSSTGRRNRPLYFATLFMVAHEDVHYIFNDHGMLMIARFTPEGYEELDRARVLEPTTAARGRMVVWSHPAFANRCMYARNDQELICVDLSAPE